MSTHLTFEVEEQQGGTRLDVLLTELLSDNDDYTSALQATRSKIRSWITNDLVLVNSQSVTKAGHRVKCGDTVALSIPEVEPLQLEPDDSIALELVYEDEDLLVVNKQAGLVVHPGAGVRGGTLIHGLLAYLGSSFAVGEAIRPGIVHRLDKDTSGLMVVAKNDRTYQALVAQFLPPRRITREYLALVRHAPKAASPGLIEQAIGRSQKDRRRMAVVASGKHAVTHWKEVEHYRYGALLQLKLETGRTHQIRVHLQHVGAEILGDPVYSSKMGNAPGALKSAIAKLGRQALHAHRLSFFHPSQQQLVHFESDIPDDMKVLQQVLRSLR